MQSVTLIVTTADGARVTVAPVTITAGPGGSIDLVGAAVDVAERPAGVDQVERPGARAFGSWDGRGVPYGPPATAAAPEPGPEPEPDTITPTGPVSGN